MITTENHRWIAPRAAYEVTALIAEGDDAAAEAAFKALDAAGVVGLIIALGAHARHAAWIAGGSGAALIQHRQQMALMHALTVSPARDLAIVSLRGDILPPLAELAAVAAPSEEAWPSLRDAARFLASLTVTTLTDAGWGRRAVAIQCRRASAVPAEEANDDELAANVAELHRQPTRGRHPAGTARLSADNAARFGRRITAWRALHAVAASELAAELGLSPSVLSRVEHAARAIPVGLAAQIREVTGLAIDGDGVSFSDTGTMPRGG